MSVNIEEIMKEIRMEIKAEGLNDSILSFEEVVESSEGIIDTGKFDFRFLEENLDYINANGTIAAHRILSGNGIIVFVKKIIRKLTKFYVEPIVEDQNRFNEHTIRVLNSYKYYIDENNNNEYVEAIKKMHEISLTQKNNKKEIQKIFDLISKLEEENAELKRLLQL